MRRVATVVVLVLGAVLAGCGLRVDSGAGGAAAPVTTVRAGGPGTTAVGSGTTTAPPSSTTTTTTTTTTRASTTSTAAATSSTTAASSGSAALCAAIKVYAVDDMVALGRNLVADPDGFARAYQDLVANAPADLLPQIKAMGSLTDTALAKVRAKEITTPEALQSWLANTAPRADLEGWVKAQQVVAPALVQRCR